MQYITSIVNNIWSILSIVAEVISLGILVSLFVPKYKNTAFSRFFETHGLTIAFIAAFFATVGSLIYSDVIGYEPCKLCWFQRIFIYPNMIILGIALWKKDVNMNIYGIVLAVCGGVVALFHYIGQLGINPLGLECLAVGYSSICAKNFVLQFGYITIPLMAFSACLLMVTTLWISSRKEKII